MDSVKVLSVSRFLVWSGRKGWVSNRYYKRFRIDTQRSAFGLNLFSYIVWLDFVVVSFTL